MAAVSYSKPGTKLHNSEAVESKVVSACGFNGRVDEVSLSDDRCPGV